MSNLLEAYSTPGLKKWLEELRKLRDDICFELHKREFFDPNTTPAPDEIVVNGVKYVRAAASQEVDNRFGAGEVVTIKAVIRNQISKDAWGSGYNVDFQNGMRAWIPGAAVIGLWEDK